MGGRKYTPGPWKSKKVMSGNGTYYAEIITDDGRLIAEVAGCDWDGRNGEEGDDNANLIVAAPDMLEALVSAREYIMAEAEARGYEPPVPSEIVADMDDAVAKAKGKA